MIFNVIVSIMLINILVVFIINCVQTNEIEKRISIVEDDIEYILSDCRDVEDRMKELQKIVNLTEYREKLNSEKLEDIINMKEGN